MSRLTAGKSRAVRELVRVLTDRQVWQQLAWVDIRSKYRLSTLGSFWITATTGVMAVSIGALYGQFFGKDISEYLPYFTTGFIVWTFAAGALTEGSYSLIAYGNLIKGSQVPIVFHVMRVVQKQFLVFLHNAAVLLAVWLYYRWPIGFATFLTIPGLLLTYVFISSLTITLAVICVRFRDVPPLVQAAVQFLFFASPIMWDPASLQFGQAALMLNPISIFLIVSRDPFLGRAVSGETWTAAVLIAAGTAGVAAALYVRYRARIAYWV